MPPPTYLVTGASGLIGRHLVRRLIRTGSPIRGLVRPTSTLPPEIRGGVEWFRGDLQDRRAVQQAVAGVAAIVHCGALVSDWGPRSQFYRTNVEGTRYVVEAAVRAAVPRLVYLSSAAVYGYPRRGQPIDEAHPQRARRIPYIASKIAAEEVVWQAHRRQGLPVVVLRPVMVFGPGCQNYVGQVVGHLENRTLPLLDGGRHVAGLAYVENVVDAILLALHRPDAVGQALNIWDDSDVTWKQYLEGLADRLDLPRPARSIPTRLALAAAGPVESVARLLRFRHRPWITRLAVLELGQPQRYDITRARRWLGYAPRVDFEQALHRTVAWVKESR